LVRVTPAGVAGLVDEEAGLRAGELGQLLLDLVLDDEASLTVERDDQSKVTDPALDVSCTRWMTS